MVRPTISMLEPKNLGTPIGDSSHQTYKFTVEENGKLRVVFYKKISQANNYPALLAKISVAVSVILRSFEVAGENEPTTAEEVLVFNDQGDLTGTASYALEDYRSFNFATEGEPSDATQKASAVPTTATLILFQVIKTLFKRWFLNDDDSHPHNLGLKGHIDFDMFFFEFTQYMKGDRPFIGNLKRLYNLTVANWISFPNLDLPPYHWPPQDHPGSAQISISAVGKNLPKNYVDSPSFAALAGKSEAHEQKFAIALSALLTHQPEVLRAKLVEYFGDLTFDYASLGPELKAKYEQEYPVFCNEKTNNRLFVDFMMDLYQQHYDNLYRVVVLFAGCENNGYNLSLLPTHLELHRKPSYYRNVVALIKKQNDTVLKDASNAVKYNETQLERRYHQVWRDSFAPVLKTLLYKSYDLTNTVIRKTQLDTKEDIATIHATDAADPNLHNILQLFGELPILNKDAINQSVKVDDNSNLRTAVSSLVDFTNQFRSVVLAYYEVSREALTEQDNTNFVKKLKELHTTYNVVIRKNLGYTDVDATIFAKIAGDIETIGAQIDFALHLVTNDDQMKNYSGVGAKTIVPATAEELSKQFNSELFNWLKGLPSDRFKKLIYSIIDDQYIKLAPTALFGSRKRGPSVKQYIETSETEPNDKRLAFILASGKPLGELNKLLILHLTRAMLKERTLPNVAAVFEKSQVEILALQHYTKSAVDHAIKQYNPISLGSEEGIKLVYKEMYGRIGQLPKSDFNDLINKTSEEYKQNRKFWPSATSDKDVETYRKGYPNQQDRIVALSFVKGDTHYNRLLFPNIVLKLQEDIRKEINQSNDCNLSLGAQLLWRLPPTENALYLSKIANCAQAFTMPPDNAKKKNTNKAGVLG